ncbi:hypothetical protein D9M71_407480 [compost metagenome]
MRQVENPVEFGAIGLEISRKRRLGRLVSQFLGVTRVTHPYPSAFFKPSTSWTGQTVWSIERCFFQQEPKVHDRGVFRDRRAQGQVRKLPHGRDFIQRFLHGRIAQRERILQQVNAQQVSSG